MTRLTLIALALFIAGTAVARTPDGRTPAEEIICDDYSGRAFGICNAYCEALDCDEDPHADQTACDRLESHFMTVTGDEMPACDASDEDPICTDAFIAECDASGGQIQVQDDVCVCINK